MMSPLFLQAQGDADLEGRYKSAIRLSLELCESAPNQFKLIETPVNSFLLVSNILPEPARPWESALEDSFNLNFLSPTSTSPCPDVAEATPMTYKPDDRPSYTNVHIHNTPNYIVYDYQDWHRALTEDKNVIISEAINALAGSSTWTGSIATDPLPWLLLLFYGSKSYCIQPDCIYHSIYNKPGPILFPPHLYKPIIEPETFIHHVMKYVKFLYGGCNSLDAILSSPLMGAVEESRYKALLDILPEIEYDPITYCANICLFCTLHAQNTQAITSDGALGSYLFLQGGERFLGKSIGNSRDLRTQDTILYPTYDLTQITHHILNDST
ncbi:encapsidation chaperone protein [Phascolarctid gammaherpesvirus 1]|uniref:Encapsidation chaperone protein n=1 Tax=Phascolarctid gammaherpesvirus 1 TaxID=2249313 RepID=A0A3S8D7U3_9GAMA|nr:encapsidation chaperone protein [Phascolarctid gammaherpesvirus 1]AZB49206.1 encapsidation chaperone protein [Phascolarctid gammaherpesvirus 1]